MANLRRFFERFKNRSPDNSSKKLSIRDGLFFLIIFLSIKYWMQKDLLSTQGNVRAPSFQLPSLNLSNISFKTDGVPSIVYFFAPWCNICHLSIENLNTLKNDIDEGRVKVYIIALDWRYIEDVEEFVKQHQLPTTVLLGTEQLKRDYQVTGYPTYYLTDGEGYITSASRGYSTSVGLEFRTLIENL